MKIEFLGVRGNIEAFAPCYSKHSGVLVDGKILFDLGEKEFLERKPLYIFITHLHADHAFFVTQEIGELGIPVFAPEKSYSLSELKQISGTVTDDSYKLFLFPLSTARR